MKIAKLFPNSQFEHWLNEQVARHLEAQAATFRPAHRQEIPDLIPDLSQVEAYPAKEDMVRA
ncbi:MULTISPECIES: hypothetical protein [unclassified Bradyrhizobium]|uniref:hypothetical protein n=1 Tax=unclassified Bradyrhizobium TaxID=2631580 RepID=UPI002915CC46|nr:MULTISPECIES: hypothetical protein [unclassified Bradyrhizobium]